MFLPGVFALITVAGGGRLVTTFAAGALATSCVTERGAELIATSSTASGEAAAEATAAYASGEINEGEYRARMVAIFGEHSKVIQAQIEAGTLGAIEDMGANAMYGGGAAGVAATVLQALIAEYRKKKIKPEALNE
ncbi:MAG: hypothetical protein ACPG77_02810 [Nannocystaceae bacterium]